MTALTRGAQALRLEYGGKALARGVVEQGVRAGRVGIGEALRAVEVSRGLGREASCGLEGRGDLLQIAGGDQRRDRMDAGRPAAVGAADRGSRGGCPSLFG